jgi:MFS family permease
MASDQVATAAGVGPEPPASPRGGVLTNPDFAKLFAGESVSLIGTYITQFAMPLVAVLTLRATVFEVGVLNVFRLAPVVVVALFAGVWLDRTRRRPVLIGCSLCCAVLIALVPTAEATGYLSLGLLYVVTALVGGLNVIFDVGSLSYVPNLVEPRHLMEANGKFQAARATAGITGPAIAGLLIGAVTAPITLSADAVSYLFSAAGLMSIRKPEPAPQLPETSTPMRRQIAEGFRAVYGGPLLRALLTQSAALNLAYSAFWPIFLVYAIRTVGLSAFQLGVVVGSTAVGGLIGALLCHRIRDAVGFGRSMIYATIGTSVFLLPMMIPRRASLATVLIMIAAMVTYGVCITTFNVNAITLRQVVTPKRLLARMNATYRLLLFGVGPLGSVIGGVLGSVVGLRTAIVIALIALTSPMLWLFSSPVFRIEEMPSPPDEDTGADRATAVADAAPDRGGPGGSSRRANTDKEGTDD